MHPKVAVPQLNIQPNFLPRLSAIIGKTKNPKNEPTKGAICII